MAPICLSDILIAMFKSTHNSLISLNPANGSSLGTVAISSKTGITAAVQRAREQQPAWSSIPPRERAALVGLGAKTMLAQAKQLGQLLSRETGKPKRPGLREIYSAAESVPDRAADVLEALHVQVHRGESVESSVRFDPLGCCAVIAPADHPIAMTLRMLVPAIVAGNTVVFKPSPETPLIGQRIAEIYQQHLPSDVLQVVHGGTEQGKVLVSSNLQLVAFTGSSRAGKHVMASAAFGLKRLVMALGGKDTLIVLADADLDEAAKFAVESGFGNAGQMCVSTENILVDEQVADRFEEKVARLASHYRIGNWDDPNADIGPMISTGRRKHVLNLIQDALGKGAIALCGGENHPEFFIRPTVLCGIKNDMAIRRRETLGPVLCIGRFRTTEEAISISNRSNFALGAVVFGGEESAEAVATRLDAGMVGINKSIFGVGDLPWVGAKNSGFGYHSSADGHRQFTQPRVVSRNLL